MIQSSNEDSIQKLIEHDNVVYFYPRVMKVIELDDKKVKIRHKFVREYDRAAIVPQNITAEISDTVHGVIHDLGIPTLYAHSGSNSARDQCFIDYEGLLNESRGIAEEFPKVVGPVLRKRATSTKNYYDGVLKALNAVVNFEAIKELDKRNLLFRTMREFDASGRTIKLQAPYVSYKRQNVFRRGSVFLDRPGYVNIGIGSPKKRIMIDRDMRKFLESVEWEYEEHRQIPFTFLICRPIKACPVSTESIIQMCNMLTAGRYFEEYYSWIQEQMDQRLTPAIIKNAFERISENYRTERMFLDFCTSGEGKFLTKHYKMDADLTLLPFTNYTGS